MTDETYPVLLESGSDNWLFEDDEIMLWRYSGDFAWTFSVDWTASDSYDNEADRLVDIYISRGRDFKFKADGRGYE